MDPVKIYSVSTRIDQINLAPRGSLEGGTKIYMKVMQKYLFKVSGLDQIVSNNAVYIGKYPCIIPENGVNELLIIC